MRCNQRDDRSRHKQFPWWRRQPNAARAKLIHSHRSVGDCVTLRRLQIDEVSVNNETKFRCWTWGKNTDSRNNRCSKPINSLRSLDVFPSSCALYSLRYFALDANTKWKKTLTHTVKENARVQNHAKKGSTFHGQVDRERWCFAIILAPFNSIVVNFRLPSRWCWCVVRRTKDLCVVTNLSNVDSKRSSEQKKQCTHTQRHKKRHNGIWLELKIKSMSKPRNALQTEGMSAWMLFSTIRVFFSLARLFASALFRPCFRFF